MNKLKFVDPSAVFSENSSAMSEPEDSNIVRVYFDGFANRLVVQGLIDPIHFLSWLQESSVELVSCNPSDKVWRVLMERGGSVNVYYYLSSKVVLDMYLSGRSDLKDSTKDAVDKVPDYRNFLGENNPCELYPFIDNED